MPDNTETLMERAATAHLASYSAWLYPSDRVVRGAAVMACGAVGIDYIDTVARAMEVNSAVGDDAEGAGLTADAARYAVAESFRRLVEQLLQNGEAPRQNVYGVPQPDEDD